MQVRGALPPAALAAVILIGAAGATVAIASMPELRVAENRPTLHASVETASGIAALLAGFLLFGRVRRHAALTELLTMTALGILAAGNLLFVAVPASLRSGPLGPVPSWSGVLAPTLAAMLLAAAPLVPERVSPRPGRAVALALGAAGGAVFAIMTGVALAGDRVPAMIMTGIADPHRFGFPAAAVVGSGLQLAGALAYAVAAAGFAHRARRGGDELWWWLAIGCALAALGRLHHALYLPVAGSLLHAGDAFRFAFYIALFAGCAREVASYWRRRVSDAVLDERRRLARELHDGVAQELAYIGRRLATKEPRDEEMRDAARRALEDSRRVIATLRRPPDEPLEVSVARTANTVAARLGVGIRLELDPGVGCTPAARDALLRVLGESIVNAATHGGAREVLVTLRGGRPLELHVSDDGGGFDVHAPAAGGFGVEGMRERARGVGGELRLRSALGAGTEVVMVLP